MKRIAFLTDLHLDEPFPLGHPVTPRENLDTVLNDLSEIGIQEIFFGGDIGEEASHSYFFEKLKRFQLQLILGNHDNFKEIALLYQSAAGGEEHYYHTEDESVIYLFLDSSSGHLSDLQLEWLRIKLETDKRVVILIHHPILEVDTPADRVFPLQNRERVCAMLADTKKEITVFCGHYHMDDERNFKNINQFMSPSLSFQLEKSAADLQVDNTRFGYRLIELEGDRIETEVIWYES